MSEKLTNNNIDDVFKNSIDNMETEPSERFWINASEGALFKSAQASKKIITRWKIVVAASLILLLGLSAYVLYMQKQLKDIKGKLIVAENENVIPAPTSINVQPIKDQTGAVDNNSGNQTDDIVNTVKVAEPSVSANASKKGKSVISVNTENVNSDKGHVSNKEIAANNIIRSRDKKYKSDKLNTSNNVVVSASSIGNSNNVIADNNVAVSKENTNQGSNEINADNSEKGPVSVVAIGSNSIPVNNNEQNIMVGDVTPVQQYVRPAEKKSFVSKLSLSLFYEPYLSDELLENESSDIVTYNNVSGNEEEVNPFSLGLKAGYDISKHLSVITGCTYYSFNLSVSPTTIYAQQQTDGDAAYYFQTSVGTVQCPYGGTPKVGDGLTVSGEEKVSYLDIPLQVKYNFTPDKRVGIYVTAALQANIVIIKKMDMQWQSFNWGGGNATEGINNNNKLYGSYYFAPGISYKVFKRVEVFFEPSLQGSPVYSSTKGTPYIGLGGGLTYHF